MKFGTLQDQAGRFISDNAATILTAGGVIGTGITGVASFKAGYAAAKRIEAREVEVIIDQHSEVLPDAPPEVHLTEGARTDWELTKTDMVKLCWPVAVPPVIVGGLTMGAIVASNMMSAKRAAVLTAAYGLSQKELEEYKEKMKEKLGVNKAQKAKDEIHQGRVDANPPGNQVILVGDGKVLCYEALTGRYFQSTAENIRKAEITVNQEMANHGYCSVGHFFDELELDPTSLSEEFGWNSLDMGEPLEVQISAVKTKDDRPCLSLDFNVAPKPDYRRQY